MRENGNFIGRMGWPAVRVTLLYRSGREIIGMRAILSTFIKLYKLIDDGIEIYT
jgi:hypothetical protein